MPDKDWYSQQSIRFTRAQVKYLIPLLPILRLGEFPPDPRESGYTDPGSKQHHVKARAKFEGPAGIAAELDKRLQNAGLDGLLLEFYYSADAQDFLYRAEHIAQCLNVSVREVEQRIRNALYFVSGVGRKAGSYQGYIEGNFKTLRVPKTDPGR